MEMKFDRTRKSVVAENLKRIIKEKCEVGTTERFAKLHGVDLRTAKRWRRDGIDSVEKLSLVARTLGVSFFELVMTDEEFAAFKEATNR